MLCLIVDVHIRGLAAFDISHMPAMTIIKVTGCDQLI